MAPAFLRIPKFCGVHDSSQDAEPLAPRHVSKAWKKTEEATQDVPSPRSPFPMLRPLPLPTLDISGLRQRRTSRSKSLPSSSASRHKQAVESARRDQRSQTEEFSVLAHDIGREPTEDSASPFLCSARRRKMDSDMKVSAQVLDRRHFMRDLQVEPQVPVFTSEGSERIHKVEPQMQAFASEGHERIHKVAAARASREKAMTRCSSHGAERPERHERTQFSDFAGELWQSWSKDPRSRFALAKQGLQRQHSPQLSPVARSRNRQPWGDSGANLCGSALAN